MIKKFYYPKGYRVLYNSNSARGNPPIDFTYYNYGDSVTVLNSGDLNKYKYTFLNWNTLSDGSGTAYDPYDTFIIEQNTMLFAQWQYSGNVEIVGFPEATQFAGRVLGYMYSGDINNPKGSEVMPIGTSEYSIARVYVNEGIEYTSSPYMHFKSPTGGTAAIASVSAGKLFKWAVYEGTLSTDRSIKLKGLSISTIQNGKLIPVEDMSEELHNMLLGNTRKLVTCKCYEFTIPRIEGLTIDMNLIFENVSV